MGQPPDSEPPAFGLRCPRCGCCDLRANRTVRLPGGRVKRYRYCRHCHRGVTTIEAPQNPSDLPKPRP